MPSSWARGWRWAWALALVALQLPAPPNAQLGNISFDSQGNPVSVNNGFLDACGCFGGPPGYCLRSGSLWRSRRSFTYDRAGWSRGM